MGRKFAGVLGPVAFVTIVARGVLRGSDLGSTMQTACLCLFGFAALGYLVGRVAAATVNESVNYKFKAELKAAGDNGSSKAES